MTGWNRTNRSAYQLWLSILGFAYFVAIGSPDIAAAHAGVPNLQTTVQQIGGYDVSIRLRLPIRVPGTMQIEAHMISPIEHVLYLRALAPIQAANGAPHGQIRVLAEQPGPYMVELPIDQIGNWEIELRLNSMELNQIARIPFSVSAPQVDADQQSLRVAFAILAGCFLIGIGGTIAAIRVPFLAWLPITASMLVAVVFGITLTLAIQIQLRQLQSVPPDTHRPYANLLVTSQPSVAIAGQPLQLRLALLNGPSGRPIDDLVPNHESLAHLVIISADQQFFQHLHPARVGPGQYQVQFTPSYAGIYTLYLEIQRQASGSQVLWQPLVVTGEPRATQTFIASLGKQQIGSLQITTRVARSPIHAGELTTLWMQATEAGQPVDQFEPWLGMAGHAIVQGVHGAIFAHLHATGPTLNTSEPTQQTGPALGFSYTFPQPGSYLIWMQFQYRGQIQTIPVRVEVQ